MENVKPTIRRVRSSELRDSNLIKKIEFPLYGTVERVAPVSKALLVSRGDNGSRYWINYDKSFREFAQGEKYRFNITLSTYYNKDGILRTDMWLVDAVPLFSDIELSKGFEPSYMEVNIASAQRTAIPNLFVLGLVRLENGEEKEKYTMRYYNDKANGQLPDLGKGVIKFEMYLSKQQIDGKGEVYTEIQTRTVVGKDGNEMKVENPIYKPTLGIIDIGR